jgi:hypothetical protein
MIPNEKTMQFLEQQIPQLAGAACLQAYYRALEAGLSVTISENGIIYEVFPDGTKKFIKNIPPPIFVPP